MGLSIPEGEGYYGRPKAFLQQEVRLACSSWSLVPAEMVERFVDQLSSGRATGEWDKRYGYQRRQPYFNGPLRVIVGNPV